MTERRQIMTELSDYLHPVWQSVALVLAIVTAAWGLRIRRQRSLQRVALDVSLLRRHVYFGATAITVLILGWIHGLWSVSSDPYPLAFRSWHAWVGTASAGLFGIGAGLGLRLYSLSRSTSASRTERYTELRGLHVFCMAIALFLAITQIVLGFPLLP